jgi:voltage-gated potassium channel
MDMHFIKVHLTEGDKWIGHNISSLKFPKGIMVAMVKRKEELIIPRGDVVFEEDDLIILGAEPYDEVEKINLKEVVLQKEHKWTGQCIKDLDISRHSIIVLVKRKNKALIPNGNMVLREFDNVFLYTQLHLDTVNEFDI